MIDFIKVLLKDNLPSGTTEFYFVSPWISTKISLGTTEPCYM